MEKKYEIEIAGKLGGIEQHLKNIDGKLKKQNDKLEVHGKKIAKHDVLWGKAGVIFSSIIFVSSVVVTIVFNWIKDKFFN